MTALVDQGIVSATTFATSILLGRLAGEEALGVFALGVSVTVLASAVQDSLVTVPYTFYRRRVADPAAYAAGTLLHALTLAAIAGLAALGLATLLEPASGRPWLPPALRALAVAAPLCLLRDYARRLAFAHHRVGAATAMDGAASALLLAGIAGLAATGRLDGPTALIALGLGYGLPALVWLALDRQRFDLRGARPREALTGHWRFGRMDLTARAAGVFQGYAVYWILAFLRLPEATGVLAACHMIGGIVNPLVLGINNVYMPRVADARQDGVEEVWRVVRKTTLLLAAVLVPATLLLGVFGGPVVALVYGAEFSGHGLAVAILAVSVLVWAGEVTCVNGLRALDRPAAYAASSAVGLAVTVGAGLLLIRLAGTGAEAVGPGVVAAAAAILLGVAAASVVQWTALVRLVRAGRRPRPEETP